MTLICKTINKTVKCRGSVRARQSYCAKCRRVRKVANQTRMNQRYVGVRQKVTDLSKDRTKKAKQLRDDGYDVPWESQNGYE